MRCFFSCLLVVLLTLVVSEHGADGDGDRAPVEHYGTLVITQNATLLEVKAAYRQQALRWYGNVCCVI